MDTRVTDGTFPSDVGESSGERDSTRLLRPQWLLFTLVGEAFLVEDQPFTAAALTDVLVGLGLTKGGVRAALGRMVEGGWLSVEGGRGDRRYRVTDRTKAVVSEGDRRLRSKDAPCLPAGQWFLVVYEVPEGLRPARDALRRELASRGFGCLTSGCWIAAREQRAAVVAVATSLGVADRVSLGILTLDPDEEQRAARKCWDLDDLNRRYSEFLERWEHRHRAYAPSRMSDEECFAENLGLLNEYRWFLANDPFIRPELLPPDWLGTRAGRIAREYRDRLVPRARVYLTHALRAEAPAP